MNEMMFYRNCIETLKKHKQNIGICLSKTYTDEWLLNIRCNICHSKNGVNNESR